MKTNWLIVSMLLTPLLAVGQVEEKVEEPAKEKIELLGKGRVWVYSVTETVPKGLEVKMSVKVESEETSAGVVYKYTEKQESLGKTKLKEFDKEMDLINVYLNGELSKQQVLAYIEGQLLYYGTYKHDKENPENKAGMITIAPILLYSEKFVAAQKWSWTEGRMPRFDFRVMAKGISVVVQGKTYITDKIRMEMVDKKNSETLISKEYWFAKGVGIVKEREKKYILPGKAVVRVLELKSVENKEEE